MMKIYYKFYILIVITIISCSAKEELPKGIFTETKMVDLMVDIELAQAKVKFESASEGKRPEYAKEYEMVYKKHQLTKETFLENVEYYCSEPIKMRQVYDEVIIKLSEEQAELTK